MAREVNLDKTYEKTYRINLQGYTYRSNLPKVVILRKAKELGLSVEKFIETYGVRIHFDAFDAGDMILEFVKLETEK